MTVQRTIGQRLAIALALATASTADGECIGSARSPLPTVFVENRGQWDRQVLFFLRQPGFDVFCVNDGMRFRFANGETLSLTVDAASDAVVSGIGERATRFHYFLGNDPDQWARDVRAFDQVCYVGIRPGVDLRLRLSHGLLEYDIESASRGAISDFVMRVGGVSEFEVDELRNTIDFVLSQGVLRQGSPVARERASVDEHGRAVPCSTVRVGPDRFAFRCESLALGEAGLSIDPTLTFSAFVGGINTLDRVFQVRRAGDGSLCAAGSTGSPDFPVTLGCLQPSYAGANDGFVARFTADGSTLLWATFLGGSNSDGLLCLDLGSDGSVFVGGGTLSPDYPVTPGSFGPAMNGTSDASVSHLSADGSSLLFSGFLGGTCPNVPGELAHGVAVDSTGVAYVVGETLSADFPTTASAADPTFQVREAFVAAIHPSGTSLLASTYFGGSSQDRGFAAEITPQGTVLVAGDTQSGDLPVTPGAFDATPASAPAFVAILDPSLTSVLYCTALGGSAGDTPCDVTIDDAGDILIAGSAMSFDFPTTPGSFQTGYSGSRDGFIAKLDSSLGTLKYGTYLGKGGTEFLRGLAVDAGGCAVVCGMTASSNFPVSSNALDATYAAGDGFLAQLSRDGSKLRYSSFIGGSSWDDAYSVAAGPGGAVYVVGETHSPDFVATAGAFDTTFDTSIFNTEGFAMGFDLCRGASSHYGQGCAGSGSLVPTLSISGCPSSGEQLTVGVSHALGGALMLLAVGTGQGAQSIVGSCAAQILPLTGVALAVPLPGQGINNGAFEVTFSVPIPVPAGAVMLQAFVGDPGAQDGVAATDAVTVVLSD